MPYIYRTIKITNDACTCITTTWKKVLQFYLIFFLIFHHEYTSFQLEIRDKINILSFRPQSTFSSTKQQSWSPNKEGTYSMYILLEHSSRLSLRNSFRSSKKVSDWFTRDGSFSSSAAIQSYLQYTYQTGSPETVHSPVMRQSSHTCNTHVRLVHQRRIILQQCCNPVIPAIHTPKYTCTINWQKTTTLGL